MSLPYVVAEKLSRIVGESYFINDRERAYPYIKDISSRLDVYPLAILLPATANEVAEIAKVCNQHSIGITIRGGGTGVSEGALPGSEGILLSMERLNKVIDINKIDRTVTAEAGVITEHLQAAVAKEGLYFPQNISSSHSCFIGGNIAVSSGSPKSLKYGPTRNYVLNLEVVLADGSIIWTGSNVNKNATGYNLTQLFVGSEGTLGIITKVVLQLVKPSVELLLLAPFKSIDRLFNCVHRIFMDDYSPSSLEFLDRTGYELASNFLRQAPLFAPGMEGLLWVELEGRTIDRLMEDAERVSELIGGFTEEHILVAWSKREVEQLWAFRKRIGEAVIHHSAFRDVDVVVPRSKIAEMYKALQQIAGSNGLQYTVLGHIGNGNFHINLLRGTLSDGEWNKRLDETVFAILKAAVQLGGTLSGEHGIGKMPFRYVSLAFQDPLLRIMKQIKADLDPNHILNPGTVFSKEST